MAREKTHRCYTFIQKETTVSLKSETHLKVALRKACVSLMLEHLKCLFQTF